MSHHLYFLTLSRLALLAVPVSTVKITSALWPHVPCCSHRRDSNSLPRLQASLLMLTCALHMAYLLQRHLYDPGYVQLFQSRTHSPLLVPSVWEHIMHDQLLLAREVPVPLWWERTILLLQILAQGLALFQNRESSFFFWSTLVNPNLKGTVVLIQPTVISCIINFVFPSFNGIQARRAEILLTLFLVPVVSIMQLFFKKPVITSPHISEQFLVCTGNTDLAILLNKDTFEPDPIVLTFKVDSTSKGTWSMVLLIVRGLLRRPSLSGSPTVTFCSVHIHNVVAKKPVASTELLQRLHGYMREHNVDFIGGDFNMSAFSTVGDVFTDAEFSAPGNSLLWGLGALEEPNRECAGFLIMPKRPGVCIHMAAASLTMLRLAWDLETNLLISLCFSIFALLICPDPAASCVVSRHNKERMQRRRS